MECQLVEVLGGLLEIGMGYVLHATMQVLPRNNTLFIAHVVRHESTCSCSIILRLAMCGPIMKRYDKQVCSTASVAVSVHESTDSSATRTSLHQSFTYIHVNLAIVKKLIPDRSVTVYLLSAVSPQHFESDD